MTYTDISGLYELFIACGQKITTDTRKLEAGSIFFALKGDHFDANTFVKDAIASGCRYAITDREEFADGKDILLVPDVLQALQQLARHHRKQLGLPVIGITGSNGKTTNKELIHAVLSRKYNTFATKGNLNNHIGVPLTLLSLTREHEMAIVEMGANHQGEIALLSDLADPDYGLITNIGKAHLEGFGGVEGIKKGKSELYRYLKHKNGTIFINGDDEVLKELAGGLKHYAFGERAGNDIFGRLLARGEYVEFQWATAQHALTTAPVVSTHMFGHYNFINLLCAAAIGQYFKVNERDINDALASYLPEMNRSQVVRTSRNTLILDAYNANPSSMNLAVTNFAQQLLPKKLAVLGDMFELGEYAYEEHRQLLEHVKFLGLDRVCLVGQEFFKFRQTFPEYHFFEDVTALAEYFKNSEDDGNTILIKGSRGMRLEGLVSSL